MIQSCIHALNHHLILSHQSHLHTIAIRVIPKSCPKPACVPGPDAPCTEVICAPIENPKLFHIELWTIVIFTIDYLVRMLTVSAVPARCISACTYSDV